MWEICAGRCYRHHVRQVASCAGRIYRCTEMRQVHRDETGAQRENLQVHRGQTGAQRIYRCTEVL